MSFTENRELANGYQISEKAVRENSASKDQYLADKKNQAEKRKLANKIKNAKESISTFEARINEIDKEIEAGAAYDHIKLSALTAEKDELEEKLLELYEFLLENGENI